MKLSGAVVFYWISQVFPDAVYKNPVSSGERKYARPVFWDGKNSVCEQIVVIPPNVDAHTLLFRPEQLPISIGSSPELEGGSIVLPSGCSCFTLFNVLQELFDRFRHWEQAMDHAVRKECSFEGIIRSCDPILEHPICLTDNHFRYVSYSRQLAQTSGYEERFVGEGNYLPLEYIDQLTAMPDFQASERYQDVYQYNCVDDVYHKNIFCEGHFVGRLTLPCSGDEARDRYYQCILREVCGYVERLYADLGSFWGRRDTLPWLSSMLHDLLKGEPVEMDVLLRLLSNNGYQQGDTFTLVQMRSHFISNESKMTSALTSQLEKQWPGSCCMVHEQKIIVFLNLSHYERGTDKLFNQELAVFLRDGLLVAGISRTFTDVRGIRAAYLQTQIALDAGQKLDPTYWYFRYDEYAYWDFLHHGCGDLLPTQICHPAINILMDYDQKNNTELCATLRTYIENQYNAVSTSNVLCIARSTFLKRLARIEGLTKLDLHGFHTRLYLAMSFAIFEQHADHLMI